MNSNYYIAPNVITVIPNAEGNNPDYISIAVVGGSAIRVKNNLSDKAGNTVVVGYAANLDYRTWTLRGGNTYVGNDANNALNIYARLDASVNGTEGLVMLSAVDHDVKEGDYYFIKIGHITAPNEQNIRILESFDTGELDTNQGINNEKNGDFDRAFSVTSTAITPKLPFAGLEILAGYALKLASVSIDIIKNNTTGFTSWASNTALATTQSIKAFVSDFAICKDKDETTTHKLTMNALEVKTDATVGNDLDVEGGMYVEADAELNNNLSVAETTTTKNLKVIEEALMKDLTVTGNMHVFHLIIDEITASGGCLFLSPANMNVEIVQPVTAPVVGGTITNYTYKNPAGVDVLKDIDDETMEAITMYHEYHDERSTLEGVTIRRLYSKAKDDNGKDILNKFQRYDHVICWNTDLSNPNVTRFYWLPIIEYGRVGDYNYVDVLWKIDVTSGGKKITYYGGANNSAEPKGGDSIALCGNFLTKARQNCIILNAYKSPDTNINNGNGPSIVQYTGLWDFSFTDHSKIVLSPSGNILDGDLSVTALNNIMLRVGDDLNATGIDIQKKKITLKADQFDVRNNDNELSAYIDALGNFTTAGAQTQMIQHITNAKQFVDRFIPIPTPNVVNSINESPSSWKSNSDYYTKMYVGDVGSNNDFMPGDEHKAECTSVCPLSNDSWLNYSDYEGGRNSFMFATLDMRATQGVIQLDWTPTKWTTGGNGQVDTGDRMLNIFLPYMAVTGYEEPYGFLTDFIRTATKLENGFDFISLRQIKSLVGRKVTIINNTKRLIVIYPTNNIDDRVRLWSNDYVTFEFVGEAYRTENIEYTNQWGVAVSRAVNFGRYLWKVVDDESFFNLSDFFLDDNNFGINFSIN